MEFNIKAMQMYLRTLSSIMIKKLKIAGAAGKKIEPQKVVEEAVKR